jgi:divalent metal cation (Fe/Co/Zn/Cd) transporter
MQVTRNFEYPDFLEDEFERAKKLEWITIVYLISVVILMALVMGSSQAMKTAWIEDILSMVPPISFLITSKIYTFSADQNFPYGYHRVVSIAFLISSVALSSMGIFLLADSVMKLIKAEHATISSMVISGKQIWLGYIMVIVMIYSTVPVMVLGRKKAEIAKKLFEKNLYTDGEMSRANWLTGVAAIAGIFGIGIGWWWADPVAAMIICIDIVNDGFTNIKQSVYDLMNQIPKQVGEKKPEPLFGMIKDEVEKEGWVKQVGVRFRQEGHVFFGEIFIVPSDYDNILARLESLKKKILEMDWRVFDVTLTLVGNLNE